MNKIVVRVGGRDVTKSVVSASIRWAGDEPIPSGDIALNEPLKPSVLGESAIIILDGVRFRFIVSEYTANPLSGFVDLGLSAGSIGEHRQKRNRVFRELSTRALLEEILPRVDFNVEGDSPAIPVIIQRGISDLELASREADRMGWRISFNPSSNRYEVNEGASDGRVREILREEISDARITVRLETETDGDRSSPNSNPESERGGRIDPSTGEITTIRTTGSDTATGAATPPSEGVRSRNSRRSTTKLSLSLVRGRVDIIPLSIIRCRAILKNRPFEVKSILYKIYPDSYSLSLEGESPLPPEDTPVGENDG